jgi:hypothetical protein
MVADKGGSRGIDTRGAQMGRQERGRWPRRSPERYKKAIPPAIVAVVGLALMLALPDLPNLGLVIFLGGLAGAIITAFLAGLGD